GTFALDPSHIDTGNGGSIGWSFSVADSALAFLQGGVVLTQKYRLAERRGGEGGGARGGGGERKKRRGERRRSSAMQRRCGERERYRRDAYAERGGGFNGCGHARLPNGEVSTADSGEPRDVRARSQPYRHRQWWLDRLELLGSRQRARLSAGGRGPDAEI